MNRLCIQVGRERDPAKAVLLAGDCCAALADLSAPAATPSLSESGGFVDIAASVAGIGELDAQRLAEALGQAMRRASPLEATLSVTLASLELVRSVKSVLDMGGHYSRPDVFRFAVSDGSSEVRSGGALPADAPRTARA